jgi:nucleoside-diphosphate kinase
MIILKPDALRRRLTGLIIRELLDWPDRIEILRLQQLWLNISKVRLLYKDHIHQDYYLDLEKFMLSGPVVLIDVDNTLAARQFCFATRTKWKDEDAPYRENLIHASEDEASAIREREIFF